MWHRLRRLLADASAAFVLTQQTVQELQAEGHRPDPVGQDMEPPKIILCASAERIAAITDKRQISVRLGADFLTARFIALVRFVDEPPTKAAPR